jgi:hypothetical protein
VRVLREHRCACVHSVHAIDSEHQRTYGRASSPARAYDIQPRACAVSSRVAYSTRLRSEQPTPYEQLLQVVLRVHRREVVQPRERMCKAQVVAALHTTKRQKPAARPTLPGRVLHGARGILRLHGRNAPRRASLTQTLKQAQRRALGSARKSTTATQQWPGLAWPGRPDRSAAQRTCTCCAMRTVSCIAWIASATYPKRK